MQRKIFITGGNGFIGRNLKEQLDGSFRILSPSHHELDLLDDEAVFDYLEKNRFDVVVHCATHDATRNSKKDKSLVFYSNLRMFFNLARCNRLYGRMFYFGSGAEYDMRNYRPKMKEDYFDTHVPFDNYGFSKYISAKFIQSVNNIYDLRLFGVFGKYEDWEIRFISNACCKALFGLDITIKQNVYFDYLYINDLVRIMKWFIGTNNITHKYYNVCTGSSIDLFTIAQKILKISGKKLRIKIKETGLKKEYSADNSFLLRAIKNFSFTPIDEALRHLYQWYSENINLIDKKLLLIDK